MSEAAGPPRLTDRQRLAWLRLIRTEGIGPKTFRSLVNRFGGAEAALAALPDLARRSGRSIVPASEPEAAAELAALYRAGGRLVALGEADYPKTLAVLDDAPPLLAVRGDASVLARPMVAIVGARNASASGQRFAATLARELGTAGLVVVSGLARGIDGAAHAASVDTGTVAVLAGGLGRIYPPEHAVLAGRIVERGCLVSEMPLGWTATARDFPRRNRIVSGLAYGVVVVEAALRSGSLITARLAGEQGREVFAVPGSPLDPRSEGANRLIRQGATLITGADHVLEALRPILASGEVPLPPLRDDAGAEWEDWDADGLAAVLPAEADLMPPEDDPVSDRAVLLGLLGPAPVSVDDLVRLSALPLRQVQSVLLDLDLENRLERHGQNRVSLIG